MNPQILYLSAAGPVPLMPQDASARAPLAVIADFVGEAIERVTLPRVRGATEARLLARQLVHRFPDTRYRLALRLRAQSSADTHLLVGVPAAEIDAVLEPAVREGRELLGVWTVGLLVAWWMKRAGLRPSRQLVVVPTPAGVRHLFLADGMPLVSRLIPHDLTGHGGQAMHGEELDRTLQYLYNARLADRNTVLSAWGFGVDPGDFVGSVRSPVRWEPVPTVRGLPDAGARGLSALAEALAQSAPRTQLAPAELRVHAHARMVKRVATAVAGIGMAVLTANAAFAWFDASSYAQAATAIRLQAEQAHRGRQEAEAAAAVSGITAQAMLQALDVYERQFEHAVQPAAAFAKLARAFDAVPVYILRELRWRAELPQAQDAALATPVETEQECTLPDGVSAAVRVYLSGEIAEDTPLRQAVVARERFEALLAGAAEHVQVLQAPVEAAGPLSTVTGPRAFAYCVYLSGQ